MKILNLVLFCLLVQGCGCPGDDIENTISNGELIVAKVKQYKRENASYPKSLEKLPLANGEKLPSPICGTGDWVYGLFSDNGEVYFSLKVGESNNSDPSITYSSKSDKWIVDTK